MPGRGNDVFFLSSLGDRLLNRPFLSGSQAALIRLCAAYLAAIRGSYRGIFIHSGHLSCPRRAHVRP